MKIKAIITGATGMVGEGVLHECLLHPDVESVIVISRKTCGYTHAKLTEIVLKDISDLSSVKEQIAAFDANACFFCAGVSSVGKSDEIYYALTYTLTLGFAKTLSEISPGVNFIYVSGEGTDSTEQGRSNWARVKGKTENDLMKLPFKKVYAFRPGFMKPTKGLKNTLLLSRMVSWTYPLMKLILANHVSTLAEVGQAMINAVLRGEEKSVIEVKDIKKLAK